MNVSSIKASSKSLRISTGEPRGKPSVESPFCWQSRNVLRRIRTRLEDSASALAIYVALTEISSEEIGASSFQVTQRTIAEHAGVSKRTVQTWLPELQRIGVIAIEKRGDHGDDRYTLLSAKTEP
jgi:CRP-like cAMP-binding protein